MSEPTETAVIADAAREAVYNPGDWRICPSTHCERAQECRSPHECSGTGRGRKERAAQRAEAT